MNSRRNYRAVEDILSAEELQHISELTLEARIAVRELIERHRRRWEFILNNNPSHNNPSLLNGANEALVEAARSGANEALVEAARSFDIVEQPWPEVVSPHKPRKFKKKLDYICNTRQKKS
jgi:hypothetical protein